MIIECGHQAGGRGWHMDSVRHIVRSGSGWDADGRHPDIPIPASHPGGSRSCRQVPGSGMNRHGSGLRWWKTAILLRIPATLGVDYRSGVVSAACIDSRNKEMVVGIIGILAKSPPAGGQQACNRSAGRGREPLCKYRQPRPSRACRRCLAVKRHKARLSDITRGTHSLVPTVHGGIRCPRSPS